MIFLTNETKRFESHLKKLIALPDSPIQSDLKGKTSVIEFTGDADLDQAAKFFFDYNIFPPHIMTSLPQWKFEKRNMKVGDTILQQVCIPPLEFFSVKLLFGVRIMKIVQNPGRKEFSYQTLAGHVETGTSNFILEKTDDAIRFTIQTFSLPGNWFTRLIGPIFSLPYQAYCTKRALQHVKKQLGETTG